MDLWIIFIKGGIRFTVYSSDPFIDKNGDLICLDDEDNILVRIVESNVVGYVLRSVYDKVNI